MEYEEFLKEIKTQDVVLRNLEIINEAVKNLSQWLKKQYSDIEWVTIAGMRDKIIHLYFGVNWDIFGAVIKDKLPTLKKKIEEILTEIK